MKTRILLAFAFALALAAPTSVGAGGYRSLQKSGWTAITTLTAADISTAVWSGWLYAPESRSIAFEINFTRAVSATAVTMTCETANATSGAMPANGSGYELHIIEDSSTSGTSNSFPHIWTYTTSTSKLWTWTVSNLPHSHLNCAFTATGGAATDVVTVRWRSISP
jgi:hypothetical protein